MAIEQSSLGPALDYTVDMVFCIDATGSMEDSRCIPGRLGLLTLCQFTRDGVDSISRKG